MDLLARTCLLTNSENPIKKSYFILVFPNSALVSATDGFDRIFPATLCRSGIRTLDRVAPDLDLTPTKLQRRGGSIVLPLTCVFH